jgi:acyl-CoA thioester hydrolase
MDALTPHRFRVKVYYEDTDAGGVVYYANYLRYLERARTEFLYCMGIDVHDYHRRGSLFVITRVDIRYRSPARLGDEIEIATSITKLRRASITLRQEIYREGSIITEADVTAAFLVDGKPGRLPDIPARTAPDE